VIWVLLALLTGEAHAGDHSVAVTLDVQVEALGKKEVRRLFTGQSEVWSDGRQVNLILPPLESAAMAWLASEVLGLPPDIYHRYLLEKAYRAGREPPPIAESVEAITQQAKASEAILTVLPMPLGEGFQVVRIN
jgi:hypothetical protein